MATLDDEANAVPGRWRGSGALLPSVIGWLDQSEEQQRKMREVIALFAEAGTVDDIGIGIVCDAFSDQLIPGLSTVQTRIRYFLFVPWVYQRLEAERIRRETNAERKAREWQLDLMESLLRGGAGEGVTGRVAGRSLKQLPSFIYWSGLRSFGIRTFVGTRQDYFRSIGRLIDAERRHRAEGEDATWTRFTGSAHTNGASYAIAARNWPKVSPGRSWARRQVICIGRSDSCFT